MTPVTTVPRESHDIGVWNLLLKQAHTSMTSKNPSAMLIFHANNLLQQSWVYQNENLDYGYNSTDYSLHYHLPFGC